MGDSKSGAKYKISIIVRESKNVEGMSKGQSQFIGAPTGQTWDILSIKQENNFD